MDSTAILVNNSFIIIYVNYVKPFVTLYSPAKSPLFLAEQTWWKNATS